MGKYARFLPGAMVLLTAVPGLAQTTRPADDLAANAALDYFRAICVMQERQGLHRNRRSATGVRRRSPSASQGA